MKRISLVLLLLIVYTLAALPQAKQTARVINRATTSFQKFGFPDRVYNWTFANDTTGGSDTLIVVIGRDTSAAFRLPIIKGETIALPGIQGDTIQVKATGNSIPFRAWGIR